MAGTKDYWKRRWQSVGGKDKVAQVVSGTDVLDSASGSSGKTESVTAQPGAELEVLCSSNEDDFSSVLSEVCCPGENCSDDALSEVPRCENDSDGTQFVLHEQPAHRVVVTSHSSSAGHLALPRQRRADVVGPGGGALLGRRALRRFRQARDERAEAGSGSFVSLFDRCESHSTRFHRVTSNLDDNLGSTPHACSTARNSQSAHTRVTGLHDGGFLNSVNSVGDTEAGGRRFCVSGENELTEYEYEYSVRGSQQVSRKLHVETWAGLLQGLDLGISQKVEIAPGCAVTVACPSCPDNSPVSPGPGRVTRNMLGWSLMEKTDESGVWLFRGALEGENLFSSLFAATDRVKKGPYHTAWWVPCGSSWHGPAIGPHTGERCWLLLASLWRAAAPLMKPWCAEGEVPTAANLNLYRGWNSCVGWHRDDEPLFGCGEAKLMVSVSFGSSAVFIQMEGSVLSGKLTCAGLVMVTFLSWMANARTSFFIVRILVGNRNG